MNPLRDALFTGLSILAASSGIAGTPSAADADGTPQLLTELNLDSATAPMSASARPSNFGLAGWVFRTLRGGSLGLQATASPTGATVQAMEGSYPIPGAGGEFITASYNLARLQTEDIYIEFWAKMPGVKGGCKFVKIFGDRPTPISNSYANATIFTNYNGGDYGSIGQVIFGDGTVLPNDGQHGILLNGRRPQAIGRSYGTAKVLTPQMSDFSSADWGTQWHHFRIHFKFNSGTTRHNEVPDGEAYLEIDGKVYADAVGLYNRNPANGPIHNIEFFGWAQHNPQPFQLWYDDIRISTGGFLSQAMPLPSAKVGAAPTGGG